MLDFEDGADGLVTRLRLAMIDGVGPRIRRRLLDRFGSPEAVLQAAQSELREVSGVGPKLEGTLNKLGFWHFEQIAKWTKKDIAIVDDELSFKGRIERDEWVKQAKALARKAKGK